MKKGFLALALYALVSLSHANLLQAYCIGNSGYLKGTTEEVNMARNKLTSISGIEQCDLIDTAGEEKGTPPSVIASNLICFNATRNGFMGTSWADNYGTQHEICNDLSMAAKGTAFHNGEFRETSIG